MGSKFTKMEGLLTEVLKANGTPLDSNHKMVKNVIEEQVREASKAGSSRGGGNSEESSSEDELGEAMTHLKLKEELPNEPLRERHTKKPGKNMTP